MQVTGSILSLHVLCSWGCVVTLRGYTSSWQVSTPCHVSRTIVIVTIPLDTKKEYGSAQVFDELKDWVKSPNSRRIASIGKFINDFIRSYCLIF